MKKRKTRKWEREKMDAWKERLSIRLLILPTTLDSLVIPSSSVTKKKLIANKLDVFTKYSLSNTFLGRVLSF